ncbi:ZN345-like protein [Mya arenaria]|uniref:ZN345-like protein n=1 Tax=Mya arenaria TaxID=6604 RepID=A0ABY7F946_MYAAR|nr:ZN345-like protein [Mya arenaria]
MTFNRSDSLRVHKFNKHETKPVYKVIKLKLIRLNKVFQLFFPDLELDPEFDEKSAEEFNTEIATCQLCSKFFHTGERLARHMRLHTGEKPYKCLFCPKTFADRYNMTKHVRTHTGEKPFECHVCKQRFSCASEGSQSPRGWPDYSLYFCPFCNRNFLTEEKFNAHVNTHTSIVTKPFKCELCVKSFSDKPNLRKHMRIHTGEMPYECSVCLRRFRSSIKTSDGFQCILCGKSSFRSRVDITRHLRVHTGEKPFKCNVCGRGFTQKAHMRSHMLVHMNIDTLTQQRAFNASCAGSYIDGGRT